MVRIKILKDHPAGKAGEIINAEFPSGDIQEYIDNGYIEIIEESKIKKNKFNNIPLEQINQESQEQKQTTTPKDILKQELKKQEIEDIKENEINWIDDKFYDSWDKVKGHWNNLIKPSSNEIFYDDNIPKIDKWFFLAHSNDYIEGKPQLVHNVMQKIPLIRLTLKTNSEGKGRDKIEWNNPKYVFFDERFDKRYNGVVIDVFSKYFWTYKIKYNGKEYNVFSEEKLCEGKCKIKGMIIDVDDLSEMNKTLKINSLSHIFIAKESESVIKTLSKENLINFTKDKKISFTDFITYLATHPFGSINNFPIEAELLRASCLLSGKVDGWPLHLAIMGTQGSRKTMGYGETIYSKFDEETRLASATNYRLKGLIPSFKKVPAEPGYILQCHRIAIIDEIGKLIEAEAERHDRQSTNIMGELNDILEHKQRSGGSGNDFIDINPTAKVWLISNPCGRRRTIYDHVGLIDPTTMSRILWWVQDKEELDLVLSENGIIRVPPTPSQDHNPPYTETSIRYNNWTGKTGLVLKNFRGENKCNITSTKLHNFFICNDDFLTIYDSCNIFVSNINNKEIERISNIITSLAREPMKSVWRPRAFHHVKLIIDGLCKIRCLFEDYDNTFIANEIDYELAELILVRMVKGWDTDMLPKKEMTI